MSFKSGKPEIMVRFPDEMAAFIKQQAEKYGGSMNSEVLRCVRERMDRVEGPVSYLARLRHEQTRIAAEIAELEVRIRI